MSKYLPAFLVMVPTEAVSTKESASVLVHVPLLVIGGQHITANRR